MWYISLAGCIVFPWQMLGGPRPNPSGISSRTIAEGEIVACGINCPMAETKWARSQLNRGAWTVILLSKKSCALTIGYSFWSSGTHSIQTIGIRAKVISPSYINHQAMRAPTATSFTNPEHLATRELHYRSNTTHNP